MVNKGILLEVKGNRCIILTPSGEFKKIPRPSGNVAVGQEIQFSPPRFFSLPRMLVAASFLVILLAGSFFTTLYPAAGYVYLDINPSIELGVNSWGNVTVAKGLNSDGQALLKGLDLYGSPLGRSLGLIVEKATASHYLLAGSADNLLVTSYMPGRLNLSPVGKDMIYNALEEKMSAENISAGLLYDEITPQQKDAAFKIGLSPPKYLIRLRLEAHGRNVTLAEMHRFSLKELLKEEKLNLSQFMGPRTSFWLIHPAAKAPHEVKKDKKSSVVEKQKPVKKVIEKKSSIWQDIQNLRTKWLTDEKVKFEKKLKEERIQEEKLKEEKVKGNNGKISGGG